MGFKSWRDFFEARSGKDEFRCPHPEDSEYCRQWGLYMRGEAPMPVWGGGRFKKALGPHKGPRASRMKTDKEKRRDAEGRRGSRHDWRKGD